MTDDELYDSAVLGGRKTDLAKAAVIAHNVNPDRHAESVKQAKKQGVPPALAKSAAGPVNEDGMNSLLADYNALDPGSVTAKHLAKPAVSLVASDDHSHMSSFEKLTNTLQDITEPLAVIGGMGGQLVHQAVKGWQGVGAVAGSLSAGQTFDQALAAGTEASTLKEGESVATTPHTEAGKITQKAITYPFEKWSELGERIIDSNSSWSPEHKAFERTLWEFMPFLVGAKRAPKDMLAHQMAEGRKVAGNAARIQMLVDSAKLSRVKNRDTQAFKDFAAEVTAEHPPVKVPIAVLDDLAEKTNTELDEVLSDPTAVHAAKQAGDTSVELPMQDLLVLSEGITPEHVKDMSVGDTPSVNEAGKQAEAKENAVELRPAVETADGLKVGEPGQRHTDIVPDTPKEAKQPEGTTGIKNETTADDVATRGLSPIEIETRRDDATVFDAAKKKLADEPNYGAALAADVAKKPRALSAEEVHALTIHKMQLLNEEAALLKQKAAAQAAGDTALTKQIDSHLSLVGDDLNTVFEASRVSGYEAGLGFRARQMLVKADYSLARNIARVRNANKGKELTPEMHQRVEELTQALNEATDKLTEYEEAASKKHATETINKIKRELNQDVRTKTRKSKVEKLDKDYEVLVKAFNKLVSPEKLNSAIDPTVAPILLRMAKNRILRGLTNVDSLVDAIHERVKDKLEGVTKRDIRDAISGYGKMAKMSQGAVQLAMREAKAQMRLISAIEDAEAGMKPEKSGVEHPEASEKVKALRAELKQKMKESGLTPGHTKTPEAARLAAYKTRLTHRIAEMQEQLRTKNFSKTKRAAIELDQEAFDLKEQQRGLQNRIDQAVKEQARENMTFPEKSADFVKKWRRFVLLAGGNVLLKLGSAATGRFVTTPAEALIGSILELAPPLKRIGAKAHREGGGFVLSHEVKGAVQLWQKESFEDMAKAWKTGFTSLDTMYGDKKYIDTPELLNSMGRLHTVIKVMPKRAEFFRSFAKIADWYERNGHDVNDPRVQAQIAAESYVEANRAILMNDNMVTTGYTAVLNHFKRQDNAGAAAFALMTEVEFPIVKVATNFADEVASYTAGGLRAIPGLTKAALKGIDALSPKEADFIMRNLKKNTLSALLASAVFSGVLKITFAGNYQRGEKRDSTELKAGEWAINGVKMPTAIGHIPIFEAMQVYQTAFNAAEASRLKGDSQAANITAGIGQGAYSVLEHIPFVGTTTKDAESFATPEGRQKWFTKLAISLLVPPDASSVARYFDNDTPRQPRSSKELLENVIPGMRQNIPINEGKVKGEIIDRMRKGLDLTEYQQELYDSMSVEKQDSIEKESQLTPRQAAFEHETSIDKVIKIWGRLSDSERDDLRDIYENKINVHMLKVDDDKVEELNDKIDAAEDRRNP